VTIDKAFKVTPRANFLPETQVVYAGLDIPIPIGYGQTNSQPTTVRLMLEWLSVSEGDKVLDVGSGSGWTTALLARLVGPNGMVYAVELLSLLVDFGQANVERLGIKNASFHLAEEVCGLPSKGPYQRILVSASAEKLPLSLLDQLIVGGRLVIPVGSDVLVINKFSKNDYKIDTHPGFAFVPLIAED